MYYVCATYPRLAHASERHDDAPLGTVLHVVRYVVLKVGRVGQPQVLPDDVEEVTEVLELVVAHDC